jgi:hypothetical protein
VFALHVCMFRRRFIPLAAVLRSCVMRDSIMGCIGGLGWEIWGAVFGRCSGTGRALVCAKRKEAKTAFDSRSITPESPHGTMFRRRFISLGDPGLLGGHFASMWALPKTLTQRNTPPSATKSGAGQNENFGNASLGCWQHFGGDFGARACSGF